MEPVLCQRRWPMTRVQTFKILEKEKTITIDSVLLPNGDQPKMRMRYYSLFLRYTFQDVVYLHPVDLVLA